MFHFLVRRRYHSVSVVRLLNLLPFSLLQLGGDPASLTSPDHFTEEDGHRLRENFGLDRPFHVQYVSYMRSVLQGDFDAGVSVTRCACTD
jgi:peptide/nickel transport system permease protein